MGKTASLKHASTANPRSRASKRQTSPSIDTDKSLKTAPRAADATPSLLAPRLDGGITKSRARQRARPQSHAQKVRQERILSKAEAVMDKMEVKVDGSKKRNRSRRARKATWDEVNGVGKEERKKAILANGIENGVEEEQKVEDEWEDVKKGRAGEDNNDDSDDSDAGSAAAQLREIREALVPVAIPTIQPRKPEEPTPGAMRTNEGEIT